MKSDTLNLKIITPQGTIAEEQNLDSVTIPLGDRFSIGIRPGHSPLLAETSQGSVRYRREDREDEIQIYSGILKIRNNLVIILTSGTRSEQEPRTENVDENFERLMSTLVYNSTKKPEDRLT